MDYTREYNHTLAENSTPHGPENIYSRAGESLKSLVTSRNIREHILLRGRELGIYSRTGEDLRPTPNIDRLVTMTHYHMDTKARLRA